MDAYGYTTDLERGTITRRAVGGAVPFPSGHLNVKVVYTAGRNGTVLVQVRLGTLELIRHLWQLTQQPGRRSSAAAPSTATAAARCRPDSPVPNRVLELWKPSKRPPGVA
jgi:hypothetical protein